MDEEDDNDEDEDQCLSRCENCRRDNNNQLLPMMFANRKRALNFRRKYSLISSSDYDSESIITLCIQCNIYMYNDHEENVYKQWKYFWPAYIWQLLKNQSITDKFGDMLWKWIPIQMRKLWIRSKDEMATGYREVSLTHPECHFYDATQDMVLINKAEDELKLEDIIKMWDKHCACDIRCPFGCTDHLISCKAMSYSAVLRKYVDHKDIGVIDYKTSMEYNPAEEGLYYQI